MRYPSDLTDDEWSLVEPLIPPGKRGGDKRTVIMREVVNGLMYILSTGCQWQARKDLRRACARLSHSYMPHLACDFSVLINIGPFGPSGIR